MYLALKVIQDDRATYFSKKENTFQTSLPNI